MIELLFVIYEQNYTLFQTSSYFVVLYVDCIQSWLILRAAQMLGVVQNLYQECVQIIRNQIFFRPKKVSSDVTF